MSFSKINVLQTNLGRCRAAHDLAYSKALRDRVDILVVAEPNVRKTTNGWFRDKRKDVAVKILNQDIQVEEIKAGRGYVGLVLRDLTLYCGYISPNAMFPTYESDLDDLFEDIRSKRGSRMVLGDFNAKAQAWGSPITDRRGEALGDWLAALDFRIINDGRLPTCVTPNGQSFIDITAASADVARKTVDWRVSQEESMSCHRYISFGITGLRGVGREARGNATVNFDRCKQLMVERARELTTIRPDDIAAITKFLQGIKRGATSQSGGQGIRSSPYWWSQEIETEWRQCNAERRRKDRIPTREVELRAAAQESYSAARKRLKKAIRNSKRAHWKRLVEDVENDIWGDGYKLVTRELKGYAPIVALTPERMAQILDELFPNRHDLWRIARTGATPPQEFSGEELQIAVDGLRNRKAPGPDGIPAELVKILWELAPQLLIETTNVLLRQGRFPETWKEARLVLIPKPGKDPGSAGAFRPLSLISALGKLYEALIRNRLSEFVETRGLLSESQYGFRKGRSTIHAVRDVVRGSRRIEERWCAFIALDVKNAFNSASWGKIMEALGGKGIPGYLINLIGDYLNQRKIRTRHGEREITAGVPQGSVLGPTLWNIVYDGALRVETPPGVKITAYADDLGVLVRARDVAELNDRGNGALRALERWMEENHLKLEPQKTEAIILKGPRKRDGVAFTVGGRTIELAKEVKYLGIYLDTQGTFGAHVKHTVQKAERRIAALARLLPNVGGPRTQKRRILLGVVHSTLLYGSSIWAPALRIARYEGMLVATQRRMLLRVACAYRTVSAAAAQVLTGTLPIQLLTEERKILEETHGGERTPQFKKELRTRMMDQWQAGWEAGTETAVWTRSLIPDVRVWCSCEHKVLTYELTQVLTGHGSFRAYTHRIGKEPVDTCIYCGENHRDTTEHTIMECGRWDAERTVMRRSLRDVESVADLVQRMITSKEGWRIGLTMLENIMKMKEEEERVRQGRVRHG